MRYERADLKVEGFAMAKDEQVSVRLPNELKIKLEQIATEEDRPVASVIRRIVAKALQGQGEARAAA
jgi:predicted DNA-binding protein